MKKLGTHKSNQDLGKKGYGISSLLCEIVMSYLLCSSCGPLKTHFNLIFQLHHGLPWNVPEKKGKKRKKRKKNKKEIYKHKEITSYSMKDVMSQTNMLYTLRLIKPIKNSFKF